MLFLILAIASSILNHLLFKIRARHNVDLLTMVVVNFAVCVAIGYGTSPSLFHPGQFSGQTWFPFALGHGCIFVGGFLLIGWTTEKQGVAVASLATRLSVIIPITAAFFLYGDALTLLNSVGIIAALLALYLSCQGPSRALQNSANNRKATGALFLLFGTHLTLIKFIQQYYLGDTPYHVYATLAFFSAFILSLAILAWRLVTKRQVSRGRDVLAGLALGCSNYGSVYFLIEALAVPGWQSSQLFPTINVAVVGLSSLCAWALFQEQIRRRTLGALAIGLVSIVLINM